MKHKRRNVVIALQIANLQNGDVMVTGANTFVDEALQPRARAVQQNRPITRASPLDTLKAIFALLDGQLFAGFLLLRAQHAEANRA